MGCPLVAGTGFSWRWTLLLLSSRAQELWRLRNLPGPGIKPLSLTMAGGFLTPGPPGGSSQTRKWDFPVRAPTLGRGVLNTPIFRKPQDTARGTFLGVSYQLFSHSVATPSASVTKFENGEKGSILSAPLGEKRKPHPILRGPTGRDLGFLPAVVRGS